MTFGFSTKKVSSRAASILVLLPLFMLLIVTLTGLPQPARAATSVTLSSSAQTETTVTLTWSQSGDLLFTSYTLYYSSAGANGPWSNIWSTGTKSTTAMFVNGLSPSSNYWFYILDTDALGHANSNTLEVTTTNNPSLQITSTTTSTASLSWNEFNTYSSLVPFDSYTVQSSSSSGGPWSTVTTISNPSQTSYTVTGLSPGQKYYLAMFDTVGSAGNLQDTYSNYVTYTPPLVTISTLTNTIDVGQNVQVTSSIVGTAPFSYQWYSNGNPVAGATFSAFTFSPASTGTYMIYVIARDSTGALATSNSIQITVTLTSTSLTLTAPTVAHIGDSIGISAKITDRSGNPLAGQTISFSVGGQGIGSSATDSSGTASLTYPVNLAANSYTILASYAGTSTYAASSSTGTLVVQPFYLTVTTTVPNLQVVSVNSSFYATDASGDARISIGQQGTYRVGIVSPYVTGSGTRAVFIRWSDGSTDNPRIVVVHSDQTFSAITKTQYLVTVQGPVGSSMGGAGWHDSNAASNATIGYVWGTVGSSRSNLVSYALDGGNNVTVHRSGLGNYSVPLSMSSPHIVVFYGITQYYLNVTSTYGTTVGSGWYDHGSNANFSVSPSSLSAGFLTYHVFAGWSGDSTAKTSTASVAVDSPKAVTAKWAVDSTQLYLAIVGVIALAAVLGAVFWMRSRHPKGTPEAIHAKIE